MCRPINEAPVANPDSRSEPAIERHSVLFLIRSLNRGGAERQLIDLASALDQKHFEVALATFYDVGELRCELEKMAGVKLYSLHKKGRWDIHWLPRLCALVRAFQPKIIVGYLSTGNWASLLGGKVAGSKVVWAIRGSDNRESGYYTWFDQANFHLARLLSRFADLVIFNSSAGKQYYLQEGYAPSRTIVIPKWDRHRLFCAAGRFSTPFAPPMGSPGESPPDRSGGQA
jgi:hypothetical protein